MGSLARFGVSMEQELLNRFDSAISRKGYTNRSEAVRDLMRLFLIEEEWQGHQGQIVGTLTILYDHHSSRVNQALLELQHTHHETIASSLHIHLNEHLCMEVIVLRGPAAKVRQVANAVISLNAVRLGRLVIAVASDPN